MTEEGREETTPTSPSDWTKPNTGPSFGPAIRRIPGWNAAHAITARKGEEPLHVPQRPLWLCRTCAQPWPCGEARLRLTREYAHDRVALRIYLASRMHASIRDLITLDPHNAPTAEAFFHRFLAWAAPRIPEAD